MACDRFPRIARSCCYLVQSRADSVHDGSMLERREPGLRDLHIVLRRIEARTDAADHLAIDDDGQTALHLDKVARAQQCDATVINGVLERFARLLEQSRGPRLSGREFNSG